MANPIKSIKVLTGITAKQDAVAKKGLVVSGSIGESSPCNPEEQIGLKVEEGVYFEKDLYVADKTYAVGFSQVGVLDVNGLLQVSGHLLVTGSLELSGSSNFQTITDVTRNSEGLYFVDNAIHSLDSKLFELKNKLNNNKQKFESGLTSNGLAEFDSQFPWTDVEYISVDIMIYNPSRNSWSNDLISVEMQENSSNNVKFLLTTPLSTDPGVVIGTKVRLIATRQTDINF